jgi:hypothetical protein
VIDEYATANSNSSDPTGRAQLLLAHGSRCPHGSGRPGRPAAVHHRPYIAGPEGRRSEEDNRMRVATVPDHQAAVVRGRRCRQTMCASQLYLQDRDRCDRWWIGGRPAGSGSGSESETIGAEQTAEDGPPGEKARFAATCSSFSPPVAELRPLPLPRTVHCHACMHARRGAAASACSRTTGTPGRPAARCTATAQREEGLDRSGWIRICSAGKRRLSVASDPLSSSPPAMCCSCGRVCDYKKGVEPRRLVTDAWIMDLSIVPSRAWIACTGGDRSTRRHTQASGTCKAVAASGSLEGFQSSLLSSSDRTKGRVSLACS